MNWLTQAPRSRCRPATIASRLRHQTTAMIICSCSGVTDPDIRQPIVWMRMSEPYALILRGKICHALGMTAEYGRCTQLFVERLRSNARSGLLAALRGQRRRSVGHAPPETGHPDPNRTSWIQIAVSLRGLPRGCGRSPINQ